MNGETSTPLYLSSTKKRKKDKNGESFRGKPISEKWKPIWLWLQSLQRTEVVEPSEITEWLDSNPEYAAGIRQHHTDGVLFSYVQKCHQKLLFGQYHIKVETKKNRVSRPMRPPHLTDDAENSDGQIRSKAIIESSQKVHEDHHQVQSSQQLAHDMAPGITKLGHGEGEGSVLHPDTWREHWRKKLDVRDSETELNAQFNPEQQDGDSPYPKRVKRQRQFYTPDDPGKRVQTPKGKEPNVEVIEKEPNVEVMEKEPNVEVKEKEPNVAVKVKELNVQALDTLTKYELVLDLERRLKKIISNSKSDGVKFGKKGVIQSDITKAWAYSEGSTGNVSTIPSVVKSLRAREYGANSGSCAYRPNEIGQRGKSWKTMFNGWDSLEKQQMGPTNWIQKRAYSTWIPTWCAYTSSNAVAQPLGGTRMDQGVQKVLDVRFHPGGDPLVVVSCNEPPNELLLYDLKSGRGKPLIGLNTQIQAVEFAANGASVVSCASNIVKVWDALGACLHTLGPGSEDGTPGHIKKIHAMCVNQFLPYLVATTGGEGDNQILLWNIQSGAMASDLNARHRQQESNLLAMDALKFASDKLLICGSDASGGRPAIVQIWDIDARVNVSTYPAHDTYITSLDVNNSGSTIITGSGDGTVGLFDIRTSGAIARLPLSSTWEITSVSFSSCETYFQASCTANCTFVWDTRMMPLEAGPKCVERSPPLAKDRAFKALHQLSHGKPMPTAENSFQVPGVVDNGDQGVNDAKWFQSEPILVTASGSGSVTMWDPTLAQPCVQHFKSHTRCVNTVAVSPKDQFICTGGDDQKVVLYQNVREHTSPKWRLTFPLVEDSL